MATWGQLSFQDSNSPIMEELSHLHDYINLILLFIISFVGVIMISLCLSSFINTGLLEIQMVEWVWTIIPAFLLLQIALPSLLLLYMMDETSDSTLTVKTIGHQWYWSYEYSNYSWADSQVGNINMDSYMIPSDNDDQDWMFRLLDVDNHTILPVGLNIRVLITSADVLHSWTVPSLGVKADAVPGRLNQVKFTSYRTGLYFGQCSEICGANHSFMPIVVELIPESYFTKWCASWLAENE